MDAKNVYSGGGNNNRDGSNGPQSHQQNNYNQQPNINKQYISNKNTNSNTNLRKIEKTKIPAQGIASNSNNGNRRRSGIPNSNNTNSYGGKQ